MGRIATNPVKNYFLIDSVKHESTCKICKRILARNQSSNQEKHIERMHKDVFKELQALKAKQLSSFKKKPAKKTKRVRRRHDSDKTSDSCNSSSEQEVVDARQASSSSKSAQPTIDQYIKPKNLSVDINLISIKLACLELITVNGRPLAMLDDSGFQKLIKPLMNAVNKNSAINSENIRKMIVPSCMILRKQIMEEVKGKLISIKVDAATRLNRSFLGINVQYMMDGVISLRTLACRELYESHTGVYLMEVILEVLKEYGITLFQIYTFTSDNGANIVKCVELLRNEVNISRTLIDQIFGEVEEDASEALMDGLFDAFKLLEQENQMIPSDRGILNGIRCGAHTLQLVVFDVIKKDVPTEKLLTKARAVSKKLRAPTMMMLLKVIYFWLFII